MDAERGVRLRNDGVDLLRIVAMAMIVLLHVLGCGGILATATGPAAYRTAWLLEAAAYGAVDCYALISGFVGYDRPFRLSSVAAIWLRVWFWSVLLTAVFALCMPAAVGRRDFLRACLPALTKRYWYVTAYLLTCLLSPLLQAVLRAGDRRRTGLFLLLLSCASSLFLTRCCEETFYLKTVGGVYLLSWLYLLGGYIGKYGVGEKTKPALALSGYALATLATWVAVLTGRNYLLHYASPTVLAGSLCLFLCFRNMEIKAGGKWQRGIRAVSPLAFSVYLIHTQPFVWTYLLKGRFAFAGERGAAFLLGFALLAVLLLYAFCSAADLLRVWLFRRCRVKERLSALDRKRE